MKPLILSFFAVILGYSFLFDKEAESDVSSPKAERQLVTHPVVSERADSVAFYAKRFHIAPECLPQAISANPFTLLR